MFQQYLKEKQFLTNLSPKTIKSYKEVYARWEKYAGGFPTQEKLSDFVIGMREAGLSITTCNISVRSFNSYLSWLLEHGHLKEPLRLKKLKEEKRIMKTFSDEAFKKFLAWRPKNSREWRFYAMFCVLIDTGTRINEVLTLETDQINFDNLLISVIGKGNKERIVPMSIELRKILWTYSTKHRKGYSKHFFCTRNGTLMTYNNFYKVFHRVCKAVRINHQEVDGAFHAFRRKFGREYLKNGGNVLYLQRIFGHTDLQTTKTYIEVETEDLQAIHLKTSLLARRKS